ncbi:MAG TPA: hypothetical protein ENN36_03215, partial [Candidatus Bathyarchaeota archaeon]|nr:hypothetical protein [Candidatus Bathyarchaeota archaeon]
MNNKISDLEQIEKRVLGPTSTIPVISRSQLRPLRDGRVVVCTSKLNGVKFLLKYNAWGFVRIQREPTYFALYVSRPLSRISYFGEVKNIVYPEDFDSPITKEQASQYEKFKEGKKIIVLKPKSLKRLKEGIPKGPLKKLPQGMRYTTFTKFVNARTTD